MAITKNQVDDLYVDDETIGGDTYHVRLRGETEFKPLCYRRYGGKNNKAANGEYLRCGMPAGWGTDHQGTGACKRCGGLNDGTANITTGKYATKTKKRMKDKIDAYLQKDKRELYDLTYELATMKALFEEFSENLPDYDDADFNLSANRISNLVGTIGTLIDKISRIEARNALTMGQLLLFRHVFSEILMKYIPDTVMQDLAIAELVDRAGGNSEYAIIER